MKQREDNTPLVTIFTYQERQLKLQQQANEQQADKIVTPDPDYDISPLNSLDHTDNQSIDKVNVQPEPLVLRQSTDVPSKSTSSVAIKIGEYADRKEPCKLHFISKFGTNDGNNGANDVTSQLKNELEKTLFKLNIQNKKENGENESVLKDQEHKVKEIPSQRSTSNVEKITALLITQNHTICKTEPKKSGNKFVVKKSESSLVPLNGILKVGSSSCSEHKNITFGKTITTLVDNET